MALERSVDGKAYLAAVEGRGIEAEVLYYDPDGDPPDLTTGIDLRGQSDDEELSTRQRIILSLIFGAVLLMVAIAVAVFGGARTIRLRSTPEASRKTSATPKSSRADTPAASLELRVILAMPDRRQKLIALGQFALERAAAANDLRIGRSWTARDALRRIPPDWPHLDALKILTAAAELTHFGGRDVSEEAFAENLARAGPIIGEVAA